MASLSDLLGKCPKDEIVNFVHGSVDGICERPSLLYKAYSQVWSLEEWFEVTEQTTALIKKIVNESADTQGSTNNNLDTLDAQLKDTLLSVVETRREELRNTLREKTIAVSNAHLQDFDWKVKFALSSDKLATIQEPLLAVDLDIKSSSKSDSVAVELNKQELKSLISSLEAANRAVSQLTTHS